ncbi:hypothetical protein CANARDRAFT_26755 [[Candida] arabinofermentans NRRL YB-2248]|uniref:Uncharacterized protein n=1 Tax=[Candida] arabinofermentans NRRL YB-2248 TaxID=983967 RepID=A0A1E4T6J7_9ASCO|nr:hypothetical protein CANARDRAFT_26755 [[Candida] arabinofermentans NRRL YB-2248]
MGEEKEKPQEKPQEKKEEKKDHHHVKDGVKRFGNAVTFGAGASIGNKIVDSIL